MENNMKKHEIVLLRKRCHDVRKKIIQTLYHAQTGHQGPSLSMVEILVVLYYKYLNIDPNNPKSDNKNYFILSKGHGSPGLYCVLSNFGLIPEEELLTLRQLGSRLQGHPNADMLPWVDFSTGSLGQGISVAVGISLGIKKSNKNNRVYCILGDGELQEGQNWEAAMFASTLNISNLTCIIDRNKIQSDGPTEEIIALGDIKAKWEAFGWNVVEIDGHDILAIDMAIHKTHLYKDKPSIIVANTTKGKGISFMENTAKWHHHPISDEDFILAIKELDIIEV